MSGQRYAKGNRAWGECARSGKRLFLKDMVTDPYTGLLVAPDWAEPPLMRPPTEINDAIALRYPAPDLDQIETVFYAGSGINPTTGDALPPLTSSMAIGTPTFVAS